MQYVLLLVAIAGGLAGALSLKMTARGEAKWYVAVVVGYAIAFTFLTLTLRQGMPLGIAYGIWAAVDIALTSIASRYLFGEPLTRPMIRGIGLIAVGALVVELGANH